MPEGLIFSDNMCYGKRKSHPGLFEIKFHKLDKKNAIDSSM